MPSSMRRSMPATDDEGKRLDMWWRARQESNFSCQGDASDSEEKHQRKMRVFRPAKRRVTSPTS